MLAGVFVGLGLATKASLLPIFLALAAAHVVYVVGMLREGRGRAPAEDAVRTAIAGMAAAAAASLAVLFVAQPYMFLDWAQFSESVSEQSQMVRRILDYPYTRQYVDTVPYWYHFRQLSTWGLGWPLGLLAWAGLAYAALRLRAAPRGRRLPGGRRGRSRSGAVAVRQPARHRARRGRRFRRAAGDAAVQGSRLVAGSHRARVGGPVPADHRRRST